MVEYVQKKENYQMAKMQLGKVAKEKGWQQNTLSKKSGVSEGLINRYWNNNVQRVDLDQLERIAKAMGLRAADLIVDSDENVG